MTTALQLIEDSYDDIEVKTSEVALTTAEINNGIRRLNRLATALAVSGLNFGYTLVSESTDLLTIPDWSEDLFISLLAIRMAPSFGKIVTPALAASAEENYKIARRALVTIPEVQLPITLPTGSGNGTDRAAIFFVDTSTDDLTTFTSNSILTGEGIQLDIG